MGAVLPTSAPLCKIKVGRKWVNMQYKNSRELVAMYSKKSSFELIQVYSEMRGRKYGFSSITDFIGDSLRSFCQYSLADLVECYGEDDASETFMLEGMRLGITSIGHKAWINYHRCKDHLEAIKEVFDARGIYCDSSGFFKISSDFINEEETK